MGHSRNGNPWQGQDDVHENPDILRYALNDMRVTIDYIVEYDVPYLAGLSHSGLIYFRDRRIPDTFLYNGNVYNIDDYWVIHERTEFDHMHAYGQSRLMFLDNKWRQTRDSTLYLPQEAEWVYQPAHQIAEKAERAAVELDGIDWKWYNDWCEQFMWICTAKPTVCPPCLDLRPYEDEVGDDRNVDLLQWISDAGGPSSYLLFNRGEKMGSDGRPPGL